MFSIAILQKFIGGLEKSGPRKQPFKGTTLLFFHFLKHILRRPALINISDEKLNLSFEQMFSSTFLLKKCVVFPYSDYFFFSFPTIMDYHFTKIQGGVIKVWEKMAQTKQPYYKSSVLILTYSIVYKDAKYTFILHTVTLQDRFVSNA